MGQRNTGEVAAQSRAWRQERREKRGRSQQDPDLGLVGKEDQQVRGLEVTAMRGPWAAEALRGGGVLLRLVTARLRTSWLENPPEACSVLAAAQGLEFGDSEQSTHGRGRVYRVKTKAGTGMP